jgi:cell division initiation protein
VPLTPIDVQQKTFVTTFRGYDLDEVDDFLDEVVTSLKDYEQRLHDAQQRIAILETQALGRGDSEAAISRALVSAQRSADLIVSDAKGEAERILDAARLDARSLESERSAEESRMRDEIAHMRSVVAELKDRLALLAAPMLEDTATMEHAAEAAESQLIAAGAEPDEEPVAMVEETPSIEDLVEEEAMPAFAASDEAEIPEHADEEVFDLGDEFEPAGLDQPGDEDTEPDLVSLGWEVARDSRVSSAVDELELPEITERIPRPWEDV